MKWVNNKCRIHFRSNSKFLVSNRYKTNNWIRINISNLITKTKFLNNIPYKINNRISKQQLLCRKWILKCKIKFKTKCKAKILIKMVTNMLIWEMGLKIINKWKWKTTTIIIRVIKTQSINKYLLLKWFNNNLAITTKGKVNLSKICNKNNNTR